MTQTRLTTALEGRYTIERELGAGGMAVQRADGAKRGQVVVVEHWLDELRRKEKQP